MPGERAEESRGTIPRRLSRSTSQLQVELAASLVPVRFGTPCALLRQGAMRPIAKLLRLQAKAT
jgi:hypothetical protein